MADYFGTQSINNDDLYRSKYKGYIKDYRQLLTVDRTPETLYITLGDSPDTKYKKTKQAIEPLSFGARDGNDTKLYNYVHIGYILQASGNHIIARWRRLGLESK